MIKILTSVAFAAAVLAFYSTSSQAETTECTEITSLPATITAQGVYCLKRDLTTNITTGNAITINTNNVTIDFNGWKLGGAAAGPGTNANGVFANGRKNITLRNGNIRGFHIGIYLLGFSTSSSGHVVENTLVDAARFHGLLVEGSNIKIVNNRIFNTGGSANFDRSFGIFAGRGNGIHIQDNTISVVSETNRASGLFVFEGDDVQIRNNRVFDLIGATNQSGITVESSNRVILVGNSVTDASGGVTGIGDVNGSTDVVCVNNQVIGFNNNILGCDASSGNISPSAPL
ncbi:MAG: hypothetical protein QNJ29_09875 [Rhizobiaceae bacterium]|nr:hypothetical protein [Rhizobiaceae bacterium]